MSKPTTDELYAQLVATVDDYLDKHEVAVAAGVKRSLALRQARPQAEKDATLNGLVEAHNARAAAFKALRKLRGR